MSIEGFMNKLIGRHRSSPELIVEHGRGDAECQHIGSVVRESERRAKCLTGL